MSGISGGILLIFTVTKTRTLFKRSKTASDNANAVWNPQVGEKAIKAPNANEKAISELELPEAVISEITAFLILEGLNFSIYA
jgi:hypothetical protein